MTIIRPHTKPPLWWLFPWSVCRQLHKNAVALKALTDADAATNRALKAEVIRLASSREHWIAKHDRAYAVAMHNERVILEMEARNR